MQVSDKKQAAARVALDEIDRGTVIGVGTGSTANYFIDGLPGIGERIDGAVASSAETAKRLRDVGIRVLDLNQVGRLPLYVDGADEATRQRLLIKGGGGALTREKIVVAASDRFVCIVDDSKLSDRLGGFPLPVEVIPMARALVAAEIERRGGRPVLRESFTTDNGNLILDVHGMPLPDPARVEAELNLIVGVVENGLFCRRSADLLLVAGDEGVERI